MPAWNLNRSCRASNRSLLPLSHPSHSSPRQHTITNMSSCEWEVEQNGRRAHYSLTLLFLRHNETRACKAATAAAGAAAAAGLSKEEGKGKRRGGRRLKSSIMTASSSSSSKNKNPLAALLGHQRYIINDGGMGTLLEALIGAPLDPKLWAAGCILTHPNAIKAVHQHYFEAGADIATTATYQATVQGYMQQENANITQTQAEDLIRKGVTLAIEARDEFWAALAGEEAEGGGGAVGEVTKKKDRRRQRPLVAASVGCYGAAQADGSEYRGQYGLTVEELMDWHRPRLALLAATDADLLAFETVPCEAELLAILRLLHEDDPEEGDTQKGSSSSSSSSSSSRKPCWITMACRDGTHLNSGESLEACARHVLALDAGPSSRVVAFGLNCTPPQHVEEALSVIRRVFASKTEGETKEKKRLLIAYPNSGEVWEGKQWLPGSGPCPTPQDFATLTERWVKAGATIVGGCCRTTPDTIQAVQACLLPVDEEEKEDVK